MRVLLLSGLLATSAWADAKVVLFPAVGTTAQVTVSGRVLKHASTGGSTTISRNLRRLTTSNWEGAAVQVLFAGKTATVKSGHDGNFEATFAAEGKPFEVGVAMVNASVKGAEPGVATVDVLSNDAPFFVVSDFDDTLAVTDVVNKGSLINNALLKDEMSQPLVEGMPAFYRCLKEGKAARPGFALVSGSPVQYVGRVASFLKRHDFPLFGLYLRDFGPNTLSGYKQPIIRALLKALPQKVVLVGDSGEHDPEVYGQIRDEFPGRVVAVYIRDAGNSGVATRFKDMVLFKHPSEAARDAAGKGLLTKACADAAFPPVAPPAPAPAADAGQRPER